MFEWLWRKADGAVSFLSRLTPEIEELARSRRVSTADLNPAWAEQGEEDGHPLDRLEAGLREAKSLGDFLGKLSDSVGRDRANRRDDVSKVELLLGAGDYLDLARTDGPTGWFGSPQERAIRLFQQRNGLTVDGRLEPEGETITALMRGPGQRIISGMPAAAQSARTVTSGGQTASGLGAPQQMRSVDSNQRLDGSLHPEKPALVPGNSAPEKSAPGGRSVGPARPSGSDADTDATLLRRSAKGELRTDPERLREMERNFNTRIDWPALASWEGGQRLEGYIPMQKGKVIGLSGVTVATGVDLGARTEEELNKLGLDDALIRKLKPYLRLKEKEALSAMQRLGAPILTKDEADTLDVAIKGKFLEQAQRHWNADAKATGAPAFTELTPAQQTIILSRHYHQGSKFRGGTKSGREIWYQKALEGDWLEVVEGLRERNTQSVRARTQKEADLLENEIARRRSRQ